MTILPKHVIVASLFVASIAASGTVAAATVYPADLVPDATFIYGTNGPGKWGQIENVNGGTATITADYPKNGDGSLKINLPTSGSSKAGAGYYPTARTGAGFGPLTGITAVSYDVLAHTNNTYAPVLRLYLQNSSQVHVATLVYNPGSNGATLALDTWEPRDVFTGSLNQSKGNGGLPTGEKSFAEYQADPDFRDLVVFAVEVGGGTDTAWEGAADNVVVTGSAASVVANFEATSPVVTQVPTPVPATSLLGLLALSGALGGLGVFMRKRKNG